jgi:hypothetical protein
MDFNRLAFRTYIVCRMSKMLADDAMSLARVSCFPDTSAAGEFATTPDRIM